MSVGQRERPGCPLSGHTPSQQFVGVHHGDDRRQPGRWSKGLLQIVEPQASDVPLPSRQILAGGTANSAATTPGSAPLPAAAVGGASAALQLRAVVAELCAIGVEPDRGYRYWPSGP